MNPVKLFLTALTVLATLHLLPQPAFCGDWQDIASRLDAMNSQGLSRAQVIEGLLKTDETKLKAALKQLKQETETEKARLGAAQEKLTGLKNKQAALEKELANEKQEIEGIQGTVLGAAKRVNDLFQHSPIGPEVDSLRKRLDTILSKKSFPGMDEIRLVAAICRNYIKESGRVRLYEGKFFSESGGVVTGRIGRIGALGGVYQSEDKTGYLTVDEAGRALSAVTGRIPNAALKKVRIFMAGQAQSLPLDISGGSVFLQFTQKKSVRQWLKSGGLLVWPILGIGVLALLLSVERVFFFLRIRANSDTILKKITAFVQEGNLAACKEYCTTKMNFPTCRILSNCLTHLGQPQEVLDSALEEALLNQMPRLEKFLPTLSMLAAISPLLGLLGTVTGMISTFQVINIFGTGDPKMMSGGISEALITTQIGLAVAIPIMFLHHIFERRVDNLVADLEEKGTAFKITLLKKESM
jgi:biopolymer transport protein ExbB